MLSIGGEGGLEAERDITYTNVVRHRPPAVSVKSATGSRTGVLVQRDDGTYRIDGAVHDSEAVKLMRQQRRRAGDVLNRSSLPPVLHSIDTSLL